MTGDARFEDGAETALNLAAEAAEDVPVLSALLQDAVFQGSDLHWDRRARRFVLLLNRCRWEDREAAAREGRPFERVRSLLVVGDVTGVASQGLDRPAAGAADMVLSLLSLVWQPGEDGTGRLVLTLAGDAALAVSAECLNLRLRDVTRPYRAIAGRAPQHPD